MTQRQLTAETAGYGKRYGDDCKGQQTGILTALLLTGNIQASSTRHYTMTTATALSNVKGAITGSTVLNPFIRLTTSRAAQRKRNMCTVFPDRHRLPRFILIPTTLRTAC